MAAQEMEKSVPEGSTSIKSLITHNNANAVLSFGDGFFTFTSNVKKDPLRIPIHRVINIETRDERAARQQLHQRNDPSTEGTTTCMPGVVGNAVAQEQDQQREEYFLWFLPPRAKAVDEVKCICFCARSGGVASSTEGQGTAPLSVLVQKALSEIYPTKPKTIVAFVSPKSGSGKAKLMWATQVLPLLQLTKHQIKSIETTRAQHAEDWVADVSNIVTPLHIIVAVGGDGMMHEVVNGWYRRVQSGVDPSSAPMFATVPAGSGCGLAKVCNVLKPIDAAMALVSADSVAIDLMHLRFIDTDRLVSPTEAELKAANAAGRAKPQPQLSSLNVAGTLPDRVAFLNVSFAITNDIDKGSEKWRWMGNARFTAHAATLIAAGIKPYAIRMRYVPWQDSQSGQPLIKHVGQEKDSSLTSTQCTNTDACTTCQSARPTAPDASTPWVDVPGDKHVLAMVNNVAWAARDMKIAPFAHVADGAMDLVVGGSIVNGAKEDISRIDFVKLFLGLEDGAHIDASTVGYMKATAIEIFPLEGIVMADGEVMPTAGVRVSMLPKAIRVVRGRIDSCKK